MAEIENVVIIDRFDYDELVEKARMTDEEIKKVENQVFDCAFELEMKYGVDISPIIKNERHYEYWVDTLPFYRNIQKEGVVVA